MASNKLAYRACFNALVFGCFNVDVAAVFLILLFLFVVMLLGYLLCANGIILIGPKKDANPSLISSLGTDFDMHHLSPLHYFFGMEVTCSSTGLVLIQI